MKKVYIILCLTANIVSTACMEQQRRKSYDNDCKALFPPIGPSIIMPVYIMKNIHQTVSYTTPMPVCEANQPGWQQLNDIADMTYKREQQITDEIELMPIYRPTQPHNNAFTNKKQIEQQEKKPFLRTLISVQPETKVMQQLYNNAYDVFYDGFNIELKIPGLIKDMNNARSTGISEDIIATFAYNTSSLSSLNADTALLFSCLKQYRLHTNKTKEPLPPDPQTKPVNGNELAKTLGIIKSTKGATISDSLGCMQALRYPAYFNLKSGVELLSYKENKSRVMIISSCLYSDSKILWENCPTGFYEDLKKNFYDKTYDLLTSNKIFSLELNELYQLLQMIDRAKELKDIDQEKDLGYSILNTKPSSFWNFFRSQDDSNRISIFCNVIEKYNQARGDKITPTGKQYHCYQLKNDLNLALPDYFDRTIFDAKVYAFDAFEELIQDVLLLRRAENKNVQQCIDLTYYSKK